MAPDKIYIQPNAHDGWFEGNKPNDNFVEYVRKDALLEWAKDMKHIYEIPVNNHQANELCRAKAGAFQIVIDKIESL